MSVYFARVRGYVKIGFSVDPVRRARTIASGGNCIKPDDIERSDPVDLLGWIPGDRSVERAMHRKFADLYVTGEWFWDDDTYEEAIWEDPFGVPLSGVPAAAVMMLVDFPSIRRDTVLRVFEDEWARALADPKSAQSQVLEIFGGQESVDHLVQQCLERRQAERAAWRAQRTSAA